ncbi:MAG TPA: SPOR domain-containing protein [Bacteroidales bacterium]|nr:SPOR domain-containing protein [Bacteroidales bacterium]
MNLYNDVYQLLSENDCVIIPGFGGFVVNYNEAEIDIAKQKFHPPSRTLAFNVKLQVNDGLLINHICQTQGQSWQTAKEYVAVCVSEINDKLDNGSAVTFGKLGKFDGSSGNLVFSPFKTFDLLESSYGLSSFYFPLLKTENELKEIYKSKSAVKERKKPKSYKKLVYVLSAAAVITGLVAISIHFDFFDYKGNKQHANVIPVDQIISSNSDNLSKNEDFPDYKTVIGEQVVYIDPELVNDEYIAENFKVVENVETTTKPEVFETTVEPVFVEQNTKAAAYVIAGSFSSMENAESFQQKYKASGFPSEILPKSNGMYRVSIKSYNDSNRAVEELSNLKNKTGNYSLWILKL